MYLGCSTSAPQATCAVSTNDTLNRYTLDFTNSTSGRVTITVATTANASALPAAWRWNAQNGLKLAAIFAVEIALGLLFGRLRRTRWALAGATALVVLVAMLLGSRGVRSTPAALPAVGTAPGGYTLIVKAFTVSGNGTTPDATATIPLNVN